LVDDSSDKRLTDGIGGPVTEGCPGVSGPRDATFTAEPVADRLVPLVTNLQPAVRQQ
jgi:hypothetical protein